MAHTTIRERFPLHLLIGGRDCSFLLTDNFAFSNVDPGGYEMASFAVGQDMGWVVRGMPVKLDCGIQVAWEGRVKEIQRSLGSKTLIQCEGYGALLKDNDMAEIFIDRDLTKWQGPNVERQIQLINGGWAPTAPSAAPEPGSLKQSLETEVTGAWVAGGSPICEAWYNANGIPIRVLFYEWARGANVSNLEINWSWSTTLSNDPFGTSVDGTGNLRAAGPGSAYLLATASNRVYALIQFFFSNGVASGAENARYAIYWSKLAVYGKGFDEFLNVNGGFHGADPAGFYPSDAARYVAATCPGLNVGVIETASEFLVPHAVYMSPVEMQQIVADMAKLVGWHWGVWEAQDYLTSSKPLPRLDFRPYPALGQPTAWAWRSDCEGLDVREDLASQYNTAKVTFTEAAGIQSTVTVTVDNPVLDAAGIAGRTIPLNLGTSTKAAAETYGKLTLELLQLQARVLGSATMRGAIHRINGGEMAPWMLKSGIDRLRIPDLPSFDVWGTYNDLPITRVECSGSQAGITTSVEFGIGKNLSEALLAELQQVSVLAGQGG